MTGTLTDSLVSRGRAGGTDVYSVPIDAAAAERARLLAELATALDQAEQLLMDLRISDDRRDVAVDVYVRIQAARLEIESLRRSRSLVRRDELGPEWSENSPWPPKAI